MLFLVSARIPFHLKPCHPHCWGGTIFSESVAAQELGASLLAASGGLAANLRPAAERGGTHARGAVGDPEHARPQQYRQCNSE